MNFKLIKFAFLFVLVTGVLVAFSACKKTDNVTSDKEAPVLSTTEGTEKATTKSEETTEGEQVDTYIILDNEKTTVNGRNAEFENNTVTITDGGVYHLSGSLSDGKIFINSQNETKKVKLILGGVNVSCSTDAPLYVENSPDETVLILEAGKENFFADTAREIAEGVTDYATAAIYSKDDLQLEGEGKLSVTGNFNKGIFSKNDIDIRGGNITINSADDGIRGKDSVEIEKGTVEITCGGDGIRTSEETEADKGDIIIEGGSINITSELDGVQATGNVTVSGGVITLKSGGGAVADYSYQSMGDMGPGGNRDFGFGRMPYPDSSGYEEEASDIPSTKGIKADKSITLSGGEITVDSLDDSIHSPVVNISGGEITASSDDDGIHADETVTLSGGRVNILKSYEGVEGTVINMNKGTLIINSADDGFNASSGSTTATDEGAAGAFGDFGGRGGKGGRGGMGEYDAACQINMKDGFVLINAEGDGVDSNGNVDMQGGKIVVFGPVSGGNGALDYGGSFNVSGGTLLATGSLGMAQSVTGNGVDVFNFNCNGTPDTVYAIADEENNCKVGFTAVKSFQNVVFASDAVTSEDVCSFYQGGTLSSDGEAYEGICFGASYTPGSLIGTLS